MTCKTNRLFDLDVRIRNRSVRDKQENTVSIDLYQKNSRFELAQG